MSFISCLCPNRRRGSGDQHPPNYTGVEMRRMGPAHCRMTACWLVPVPAFSQGRYTPKASNISKGPTF